VISASSTTGCAAPGGASSDARVPSGEEQAEPSETTPTSEPPSAKEHSKEPLPEEEEDSRGVVARWTAMLATGVGRRSIGPLGATGFLLGYGARYWDVGGLAEIVGGDDELYLSLGVVPAVHVPLTRDLSVGAGAGLAFAGLAVKSFQSASPWTVSFPSRLSVDVRIAGDVTLGIEGRAIVIPGFDFERSLLAAGLALGHRPRGEGKARPR
jgi:hypothetical protein